MSLSIKSRIDEGFDVIVLRESDVRDQINEHNWSMSCCKFCNTGAVSAPANLTLMSHAPKIYVVVHDHCYVGAMAEWGIKEKA